MPARDERRTRPADSAGLWGLLSSAMDLNPNWTTFVSLFDPLLGCPIECHDGSSKLESATMRELAQDAYFGFQSELPPATSVEIESFHFCSPQ